MTGYLEFDIGVARLTEYNGDKFPVVQVDSYGEGKSGTAAYELHSPRGLISRCHDPDVDSDSSSSRGNTVLYAFDGGQGHAWLQSDPRVIPLLPPMLKGGTVLYGGKLKNPSFMNINGDTNSQTFYVPYAITNDVAAKSMCIDINVDHEGEESISIIHGSGAAIMIVENNGEVSVTIKNAAGDAYLEVNDDGVVVNGPLTINGSMNAGGPAGALPVSMAVPSVAALTALQAQLAAVSVALLKLTTSATPPIAIAELSAAVSAITAGTVLVAASIVNIPAKNTGAV